MWSDKISLVALWAVVALAGCQRSEHLSTMPATKSKAAAATVSNTTREAETSPAEAVEYIRPFPVVMYDSADEQLLAPYAQCVAKRIGSEVVQAAPRNPVCCVWIELSNWVPNPGVSGYIINNQPGGSVIQASNEEQLRLALDRFESSMKTQDGKVKVPAGLMTNYHVHP
jgi:hypothetical protein